jgi:TRAP transporter TAXI family solute receptor
VRRPVLKELPPRSLRHAAAIALVVAAVLFWLSFHFLRPIPPRSLTMTTGMVGGSYAVMGERYRQLLARDGVRLDLMPSSGSVENLARLRDESKPVDAGFVQGGVGRAEASSRLMSLGSVFYSPLWVFYRGEAALDDLAQLRGRLVSIGPEGSGVRKFSVDLLKAADAADPPTELFEYPMAEAGKALKAGRIDAVMAFGSADSALVMELLNVPGIRLMSFGQAEAYSRLFPNLSHVVLPKGVLDPARRSPAEDVHLLAPTTNLIVRANLHPALVHLLLEAAAEIHSGAGWVHGAGEFPALKSQDLPISDQAQRYFKSGASVLYDYLPFWLATFLDRMTLLLIPLGFVLIPAIGILPWAYTWRNRSRLYRWYRELRELDLELRERPASQPAGDLRERLDRIDDGVGRTSVGVAFYDEIFILQQRIAEVRRRLGPVDAGAETTRQVAENRHPVP